MLVNFLERDVTSKQNLPSSQLPTAYLVISMALIQMVKAAGSSTFGELSQKCEAIVTSTLWKNGCTRVYLIFDQYRPLRQGRRAKKERSSSLEVNIHSGSTPILKQWTKFISNLRNKERLDDFVGENLIKQLPERLGPFQKGLLADGLRDGSRTVSLAYGSTAAATTTFRPWRSRHKGQREMHTTAHHSFFPWSLSLQVFTIFTCSNRVWLNECFCWNTKTKPWKVLIKKDQLQRDLSSLGQNPVSQESIQSVAKSFICSVYTSAKSFLSTYEARYFLLC